jgi:hypothetical protein
MVTPSSRVPVKEPSPMLADVQARGNDCGKGPSGYGAVSGDLRLATGLGG